MIFGGRRPRLYIALLVRDGDDLVEVTGDARYRRIRLAREMMFFFGSFQRVVCFGISASEQGGEILAKTLAYPIIVRPDDTIAFSFTKHEGKIIVFE